MSSAPQQTQRSRYVVPIVIVVVTVLLVALVWFLQSGKSNDAAEAAPQSEAQVETQDEATDEPAQAPATETDEADGQDFTQLEGRDPDDPMAVGPIDAPVGMVVFTDYQCMYCGKWNHDTLPALMEYVDAGELRIEWRDTNNFGMASEQASKAGYAAALQGKFLEYNDALFPDGGKRSESELSPEALIELAGELGLDVDQFTADMEAQSTEDYVLQVAAFAHSVGVTSTPTFTLGGTPIVGAQPTEVFVETFQKALAAS